MKLTRKKKFKKKDLKIRNKNCYLKKKIIAKILI